MLRQAELAEAAEDTGDACDVGVTAPKLNGDNRAKDDDVEDGEIDGDDENIAQPQAVSLDVVETRALQVCARCLNMH